MNDTVRPDAAIVTIWRGVGGTDMASVAELQAGFSFLGSAEDVKNPYEHFIRNPIFPPCAPVD